MMRIFFPLLSLFFSLPGLFGQSDDYWVKAKGPSGGDMEVIKTSGGILYGRYYPNAFYRSADNGVTWSPFLPPLDDIPASGFQYKLSIGPSGKFYLAASFNQMSNYDLYVSDNEGDDWQLVHEDMPFHTIFETNAGSLLALYNYEVWRSADGGFSWEEVFSLSPQSNGIYSLNLMANGDPVIFHSTESATYHSSDEGQTWQLVNKPTVGGGLFIAASGTFFLMKGLILYRSDDEGANWTEISLSNLPYQAIVSMYSLPSGRLLGADVSYEKLLYSDDDGLTWQVLPTAYDVRTLKPTPPLADGTIFGISKGSLYRSADSGITWQFSANGLDYALVEQLCFVSPDTFFASTADGIWRTFDSGNNWSKLTENKRHYDINPQYRRPLDIFQHSLLTVEDGNALWSEDLGETFENVTPPGGLYNWFVKISPDGSLLFLNGPAGMCRSADEGDSWTTVVSNRYFREIAFHPSGRIYAVLATGPYGTSSLWFSDDAGVSWTQTNPAAPSGSIQSVFINNTGQIFLRAKVPFGGLRYRSDDNGVSWDSLPLPAYNPYNVGLYYAENAEGHIMELQFSDDVVYRTLDHGILWDSLPIVGDYIETTSYSLSTAAISPDQYLYVGINYNGLAKTGKRTTEGAYLTGVIRMDADADCSTPDAQIPLENWNVKAEGGHTWYATTDAAGRYLMFIDTGNYQVSVTPPQSLWWDICDNAKDAVLDELLSTDTADFVSLGVAECPLMTVDVAIPNLRRCFDNTVYIHYCNQGVEHADSAWVDVTLDPFLSFAGSAQSYSNLGNNTYRFYVGHIESGECGQFNLVVHVDCDGTVLGQTHCITAHGYPDTLCTSVPNWSGAAIEAEVECQDTSIQLRLRNTGGATSQDLEYIIIEDDVVLMNGNNQYDQNETLTMTYTANGHTWRIESQQEPGHPFSVQAVAFSEGCGGFESLGFINQFNVNTYRPSWERECRQNTNSYDPNDKQGFPLGYDNEHYIRPGQELEYLIRFQNTGTDTAFNVVITDTLSPWLDPASVRPGAASHPYTWELSGQGVLRFTFADILLPDSNTNLAGSQGFVAFRIGQQPEVPLQTQIFNSAAIYFDFNAPVITNQTMHTIGEDYLVGTNAPVHPAQPSRIFISPNPAAESAIFQLKEGFFDQHRITVTDAYGRKVRESKASGKQFLFQRNGLPPGAYFFRVEDAKGKWLGSGKLILR